MRTIDEGQLTYWEHIAGLRTTSPQKTSEAELGNAVKILVEEVRRLYRTREEHKHPSECCVDPDTLKWRKNIAEGTVFRICGSCFKKVNTVLVGTTRLTKVLGMRE